MPDNTFKCTILTPERAVLDTSASFVAIPAHDGEIGIMVSRAPLLCRLGVGIVRMETPHGASASSLTPASPRCSITPCRSSPSTPPLPRRSTSTPSAPAQQEASSRRPITAEDHAAKTRALARAAAKIKLATS